MAIKLTPESFVNVVKQSKLIPYDQLKTLLKQFKADGVDLSSSRAIADALVAGEHLTQWQSEKLLQGKHKGFFLGKYRLMNLLGKGGMSSVFLAEHVLMRRRCAIKVLPAKRVNDSSYLARFHREAQAVASLDHPNIVRAYDVDKESDKDNEIHFLVMEHVSGASIQEMVADDSTMGICQAAEYFRQASLGLHHAHEHGLVHRDVKPANLLVDSSGVVKILDLGLARFFDENEENPLTVAHDEKVLGTADYLAPEQALDSHRVDIRADIYSLGCSIYFALTGHPPFTEGTLAQRLMWHQSKEPPPITDERQDLPESLHDIIRKMMAKDPDDRYQTASDAAEALLEWLLQNGDAEWREKNPGLLTGVTSTSVDAVEPAMAIPVATPVAAIPADGFNQFLNNLETPSSPTTTPNPDQTANGNSGPPTTPIASPAMPTVADPQPSLPVEPAADAKPDPSTVIRTTPLEATPVAESMPVVESPPFTSPPESPAVDASATEIPVAAPIEAPTTPVAEAVEAIPAAIPAEPATPVVAEALPLEPVADASVDPTSAAAVQGEIAVPAPEVPDTPSFIPPAIDGEDVPSFPSFDPAPAAETPAFDPTAAPAVSGTEPMATATPTTSDSAPSSSSIYTRKKKPALPMKPIIIGVAVLLLAGVGYGVVSMIGGDGEGEGGQAQTNGDNTDNDNENGTGNGGGGNSTTKPKNRGSLGKIIKVGGADSDLGSIKEALTYIKNNKSSYERISRHASVRIEVTGGKTYNERITIDNSKFDYPTGIQIYAAGDDKAILKPSGSGPVISLKGSIEFMEIKGFEVDANGSDTAIELTGYLTASKFTDVKIRGFKSAAILSKGAAGSFNDELRFERVDIQGTAGSVGLKVVGGEDVVSSRMKFLQCKFIGPMERGIMFDTDASFIEFRETVVSKCSVGAYFAGSNRQWKSLLMANLTFHDCDRGIVFTSMPASTSNELIIAKCLFVDVRGPEGVVESGFKVEDFRKIFSNNGAGIDENFSNRDDPGENAEEIMLVMFPDRQRITDIQFHSTKYGEDKFLSPKGRNLRIGGKTHKTKPYVGAVAP